MTIINIPSLSGWINPADWANYIEFPLRINIILYQLQNQLYQFLLSLGIEPMTFMMLAQCSNFWATRRLDGHSDEIKPKPLFFGIRCTDESFKIKTMNVLNMVIFDFMLTLTILPNSKEHVAVSLSSLKLYKLLSISVKIWRCIVIIVNMLFSNVTRPEICCLVISSGLIPKAKPTVQHNQTPAAIFHISTMHVLQHAKSALQRLSSNLFI